MGELKKAYIAELEQRLSDWWNEIGELEARMKKANVETGNQLFIQINELRKKRDETKELLQSMRESERSDWQPLKGELEKAWQAIRSGLDKIAKGFEHEWDEWDDKNR